MLLLMKKIRIWPSRTSLIRHFSQNIHSHSECLLQWPTRKLFANDDESHVNMTTNLNPSICSLRWLNHRKSSVEHEIFVIEQENLHSSQPSH